MKINLVENYDPNLGVPIVYYYWSNHYNHSSYNNLIITGLCGIRPSESDTLNINPLIDNSITYFCLDGLLYHGHQLTVVYDKDSSKYKLGEGLTVFVDGKKTSLIKTKNRYRVVVGKPIIKNFSAQPVNYALNIWHKGYPVPSASSNANTDTSLYQAIDGRIWYFPEITNRWTTEGSASQTDWYAIDFGKPHEISSLKLYLFADNKTFAVPDEVTFEYENNDHWFPVKLKERNADKLVGNTVNTIAFDKITTNKIRIIFKHTKMHVAVSEIECY